MTEQDEYSFAQELCRTKGVDEAISFLEFLLKVPNTKIHTHVFIQDTLTILKEIREEA